MIHLIFFVNFVDYLCILFAITNFFSHNEKKRLVPEVINI
jgi:hypothetical protein